MKAGILITGALLLSAMGLPASADIVVNDDQIVVGKFCQGIDCTNGQTFGNETVRLRENNTRLTFIDMSADPAAQSWRMVANSRLSGGPDHFQFQVQPDLSETDDGTPVAHFGTAADDGIALGRESEIVDGAVSIGQASLERRIMHVARMLADTDLATVSDVDSHADAVHAKLDVIDAELDEVEILVQSKEPGSGSTNPFVLLGLLGCFVLLRCLYRQPVTASV